MAASSYVFATASSDQAINIIVTCHGLPRIDNRFIDMSSFGVGVAYPLPTSARRIDDAQHLLQHQAINARLGLLSAQSLSKSFCGIFWRISLT